MLNLFKKNYYFIVYECTSLSWKPNTVPTNSHTTICQNVTDKHPIQFQLDCNEKYGKSHETAGGYFGREEYKVINWIKLTKKEYKEYKGQVG